MNLVDVVVRGPKFHASRTEDAAGGQLCLDQIGGQSTYNRRFLGGDSVKRNGDENEDERQDGKRFGCPGLETC